ncbi:MAG: apolipoprotein N-acyltransferase [Kiritimatiellia bacterium]
MKKTFFQLLVALLSALFIGLLWEPFDQSGGVWFSLVPLLLLIRTVSVPRAAVYGFVTGFVSWVIQLFWMLKLTDNDGPWILVLPALLGLSAVLASFISAFAALAAAFRRRWSSSSPSVARVALVLLVEPVLWAGLESLRGTVFTGFAWNPLGLVCTHYLPLAQLASVGGVVLVSAVLVAANGAVASIFERCWWAVTHRTFVERRERFLLSMESALPFLVLIVAFYWGMSRFQKYAATPTERMATFVVERTEVPCIFSAQASLPIWERSTPDIVSFFKADAWIWPESALAGSPMPSDAQSLQRLRELSKRGDAPLIVGGSYETLDGWYNAAMLITESGLDTLQVYGKRHLVPFGEYIPFDKTFPWLQRFAPTGVSCLPGEAVTTITLPSGIVIGPLICFEDTVADVARESVRNGAQVLVNMSNDAWYTPSPEAAQHARQAVMRCIETGVPMVRSTNGGLNTVINAIGIAEEMDRMPTRVRLTKAPFASLYLQFGEIFGATCALFVLVCCVALFLPLPRIQQ